MQQEIVEPREDIYGEKVEEEINFSHCICTSNQVVTKESSTFLKHITCDTYALTHTKNIIIIIIIIIIYRSCTN
jgi:hypothetical protein